MSARVHEIHRLRAPLRRIVVLLALQKMGGGGGFGEGGEGLGEPEEALLLVDWTEAGGVFYGAPAEGVEHEILGLVLCAFVVRRRLKHILSHRYFLSRRWRIA